MKHILGFLFLTISQCTILICSNFCVLNPVGPTAIENSTIAFTPEKKGALNILDVYPQVLSVNQAGTNQPTFSISSNINWSISSNQSWLAVNKSGGSGNEMIIVSALANPLLTTRTGTLTVSGPNVSSKTVLVTQIALSPSLNVSPVDLTVAATQNSSATFNISSNTSWNIRTNQNWLQTNLQSGNGNVSVVITAQKNPVAVIRKATITCTATGLPDRIVSVAQEAAIAELSVNPKLVAIGALFGSQKEINVQCNTIWTAVSDQSWLKVNPAGGSGNSTLTLFAEENPAIVQRTAMVTISAPGTVDEHITITQNAASPYFDVIPADLTISDQASNNRQIIVSTNIDWTATSDKNWLTLSKTRGSGSATILLLADQNNLIADRLLTLTFSPSGMPPKVVMITQLAGKPSLVASPLTLGIGASDGSNAFLNISSNTLWDVSINENWIVADRYSGNGNALLSLTAQENPAVVTRTATIRISSSGLPSQLVTLTQNASGIRLATTPDAVAVPSPASSSRYFDINSNIEWLASTDQNWLKLSKYNGNGNDRIYLLADENILARKRTANVSVSGQGSGNANITVIQEAALVALVVSPKKIVLQNLAGESKKINIESNSDWIAECPDSWLSLGKITGFGSDTLLINAEENLKTIGRSTQVTISSKGAVPQTVEIDQQAAPVNVRATPTNVLLSASAGSSQSVFLNANTSWLLKSNQPWLTFDKVTGNSDENILFSATANPIDKPRFAIASISASGISDVTIGVEQRAASSFITVSPDSLLIGSIEKSTQFIDIFSNTDWTISSNQSWLKTDVASGSGSRSITLTAHGNPSPSRRNTTISIKVAGLAEKTIYVIQEAAPVYLSASPQRVFLSSAPGNMDTILIQTNATWNFSTDQKWLRSNFQSGSGNTTLTLTAEENRLLAGRTALVSIQGKGAPPAFVIVEQQANIASSEEHEGTWKILDIYPNPVSNLLFYNIKSEEFGLTADIFTICGEKIQSLALYANHTAINVENLLPGIYMLQVKSEKSGISENHKFVKM